MINDNKEKEEEKLSIELKNNNNIVFHKQRGTIITWKENSDFNEDDSAISFQEKEGFLEIFKNILICEGKDPEKEQLLVDDEEENIFEVSSDNLPNLIREISTDMGEDKICKFILYLRESNFEFVKDLGRLLEEEEKKMEESTGISTSSDISANNITSNINNSNNVNIVNNSLIKNNVENNEKENSNQNQNHISIEIKVKEKVNDIK